MDVRLPDGTVIQGVPEGTTKAQLAERLKANGMAVPSEWIPAERPKSTAEKTGGMIRDIPRQIGLTARYGVEGLGRLAEIGTEPIRNALQLLGAPQMMTTGQAAASLADMVGLPSPQNADERAVGEAARTVAAGGGLASLSRAAVPVATGTTRAVLQQMAANPGTQLAGAGGAGLAGGAVKEAGGGPVEQVGAALLGGVAAGSAVQAGSRGVDAARRMLTPQTTQVRAADQQIQLILERSGINWTAVPEGIKTGLRQEIAEAMNTGQPLRPDAVRRLAAYRITGTQPTVGQLTQDPSLITREQNLARMGANSQDPALQRLPQLVNQNTGTLLRNLDDLGAANAPDAFDAGRAGIAALQGREASAKANINALYDRARDTAGRSAPLDGYNFTSTANRLMDEAMVGGALPKDVASTLNKIASGEMPFTVEIAEQLKTQMGKLQRASSDGQARMALGLVRQALDDAPLRPAPQVNPGNLPAVPGTVPPSPAVLGEEAIGAFNQARSANRAWMQRVESTPALKAVVDGVQPDAFVRDFVVSKSATVADLGKLRQELTPTAVETIKQYLAKHLRDAATNNTDDITKFSQAAYNKALSDLGERKLGLFFSPEEIVRLKAVGQAAKYMQSQPAGSAVNNSNSGALVMGRGLDWLDKIAGYVPLGGRDVIRGAIQGQQQTQILTPQNALIEFAKREPVRVNPLLAATVPGPVQSREDDGR